MRQRPSDASPLWSRQSPAPTRGLSSDSPSHALGSSAKPRAMEEYRVHNVSSQQRYCTKPSSPSDGSRGLPSQTAQGIRTGSTQYSTPDKSAPPISHSTAATTESSHQLPTPSSSKSYSSSKNSAPTSSD